MPRLILFAAALSLLVYPTSASPDQTSVEGLRKSLHSAKTAEELTPVLSYLIDRLNRTNETSVARFKDTLEQTKQSLNGLEGFERKHAEMLIQNQKSVSFAKPFSLQSNVEYAKVIAASSDREQLADRMVRIVELDSKFTQVYFMEPQASLGHFSAMQSERTALQDEMSSRQKILEATEGRTTDCATTIYTSHYQSNEELPGYVVKWAPYSDRFIEGSYQTLIGHSRFTDQSIPGGPKYFKAFDRNGNVVGEKREDLNSPKKTINLAVKPKEQS